MPNKYHYDQVKLLITQKALKKHLKKGDSIFTDKQYVTDLEKDLKEHGIKAETVPLSEGYQFIITKVQE